MVECYSGHEYAQRPVAFEWEGERKIVESVLNTSRTPAGRCFRVRTIDHQIFDLCYDESQDVWSIQPS
jgi:hypothetical protein